MRLAGPALTRALTGLSLTIVAGVACLGLLHNPVFAAESLMLSAQKGLSLTNESEAITVQGPPGLVPSQPLPGSAETSAPSAWILIHLSGPANISEVGLTKRPLAIAGTVTYAVNAPLDLGSDGSLRSRIVVPFSMLPRPGGYLAEVELVVGTTVTATGSAWFGKVVSPQGNLDVAVAWPLTLGVHRDADGVFFDRVLEDALAGYSGGSGGIAGLTALAGDFPNWQFTLAVEPIVLSQLRDMSDGYSRRDATGAKEQVGADQQPAKNAAAALSALKDLLASEGREVAVTPYAAPSMEALAGKGWHDGLQQMQLGKQVVQQGLALVGTIPGAYASDLDISTDSLASYGQASIDHILVSSAVAADLAEPLPNGAVTARVRDKSNQRATLVFAEEKLQALISPPWDVGLFCAGLAAALASGSSDALVITPMPGATIPPQTYLRAVGEVMRRFAWMRTLTVTELVRAHSPGSRPVLLNRSSTAPSGYIAQKLQASVETAHQAVSDIAGVAGPGQQPVETAQALLYSAESRWWSLPETSPAVASVGLLYAERARALAEAELSKITVAGFGSTRVGGGGGSVELLIDNAAAYTVKVDVRLTPEGVALPDGSNLVVEVKPGRTVVPIHVVKTEGEARLHAQLVAGAHTLGETAHSLHFVTILTFVPWIAGALVLIAIAVWAVLWVRRRTRGGRHSRP